MRIERYIFPIIGAALLSMVQQPLLAQQKIDPTLEVRRDFDAYLLEIQKSKIKATFPDTIGSFNLNFDYSIFDKPITNLYEFSPLPSAQLDNRQKRKYPFFYGNVGLNMPVNPHLDIYLQPNLPSNFTLSLYGKHESFWGDLLRSTIKDGEAVRSELNTKAPSIKNNVGLYLGHNYKKGELGLNLEYDRNLFSFYGSSDSTYASNDALMALAPRWGTSSYLMDTLSHSYGRFGTSFYIKSTNDAYNYFYYDINLRYNYINDNVKYLEMLQDAELYFNPYYSLEENYVDLKASLGPVFAKHHKFLIDIEYQAANSINSIKLDRYNVDIFPRYLFNRNKWIFEVGLKLGKYVDKTEDAFNIYFRGALSYEVAKEKLWLYASIDGDNNFRTYSQMMDLNPWITPAINVKNTREPWIIRAGFKGEIRDRLSYNIWFGYNDYVNYMTMFYYTDNAAGPVNTFITSYNDMRKTSAGGEIFWKSDMVESGLSMVYSNCTNENSTTVFNVPPFEARAFARYNWRERIIAGLTVHYRSRTSTLSNYNQYDINDESSLINIPSFAVVNMDVTYAYNKNLSIYLKLNNLLNANDLYYLNYGNPGIGAGIGVVFKF